MKLHFLGAGRTVTGSKYLLSVEGDPALPLYTRQDAENSLKFFVEVEPHKPTNIYGRLQFEFIPSGHLLGAVSARFRWNGKSIFFG